MTSFSRFYDRLVSRYIDVTTWPASRKAALVMAAAVPFHAVFWAASYVLMSPLDGVVDLGLSNRVQGIFLGSVLAVLALSLAAAARGREGAWTILLLIAGYGGPIALAMHVFGTWSSAFVAFYPLALLLVILFFDQRFGVLAAVAALLLLSLVCVAEVTGLVAYAPFWIDRDLDAHRRPRWVATQVVFLILVFVYYFTLLQFSASARLRQQHNLAAAHAELARTQERLARGHELIRRYVPSQLAEHLLSRADADHERPERRKLTTFFSDVEGFTEIADQLEPEDLAGLLNEYLAEMAIIAEGHGGTVNHFVGDGIMVLFGAPHTTTDRDHALRAVRMALAMQERMRELERKWFEAGIPRTFRVRVGINTGVASVGSFGSAGRMTYSAIGTQTNLAARIQSHCEPGKVLVSHPTWALVREDFECLDRGEISVKGLHYSVRVYEVLRARPPA